MMGYNKSKYTYTNIVKKLIDNFVEGEDYQECQYNFKDYYKNNNSFGCKNLQPNKKSKRKGRGGHNKKLYEVTPDCFKNMLTR